MSHDQAEAVAMLRHFVTKELQYVLLYTTAKWTHDNWETMVKMTVLISGIHDTGWARLYMRTGAVTLLTAN